ncbi:type 1 glutamine amidotransferase domain-containing protein [Streptomyces ipomoeae]|uniref:type 1 glutamine amidotransferase domain-containing protein n=1 Tax=Streptomyces ipomoeae TaxID=103232 RepID=UPI0029C09BDB|nr:type 1 glutamine amidotransferase domain-containing protein [Streptomyces ipomoeae]
MYPSALPIRLHTRPPHPSGRRTSANGYRQPAGFWAEEALGPYAVLKGTGHEIAVATTPGGVPPTADALRTADALSLTPEFNGGPEGAERMKTAPREATEPANPMRIEDVRVDRRLRGRVPPGRLGSDGGPARQRRPRQAADRVAGLRQTRVAGVPRPGRAAGHRGRRRRVQHRLVADLGANCREAAPFTPHIEVDRTLYTGQNPMSAVPLAQDVIKTLG